MDRPPGWYHRDPPFFVYRTTTGECVTSMWEIRPEREEWIAAGPVRWDPLGAHADDSGVQIEERQAVEEMYAEVCGDAAFRTGEGACVDQFP